MPNRLLRLFSDVKLSEAATALLMLLNLFLLLVDSSKPTVRCEVLDAKTGGTA